MAEPAPSKIFSHAEIMHFLCLMEETLPTGNDETKLVASRHAEVHPLGRSALSLRRKIVSLRRIKHPTGDPNMPESSGMSQFGVKPAGRLTLGQEKRTSVLKQGSILKRRALATSKKEKTQQLLQQQMP